MSHRGGGPRYARQNIKDAPITPQLVERILALVPPKPAPATTNVVPLRPQKKNGADARITGGGDRCFRFKIREAEATPLPAFKNTPRGASGTARKASGAGESTPASRERAATPAPQRRPARAPIAKVQKASVIRRPAPQPAEEVKASPPPPPIKTESSMPKPPQASAATSAPSCPPRAEVAPLPKKPVMGWVERQMAEVAEAKAYLERRGFAVTRADRDAQIARWFLSGWRWPLTNHELIEAARRARMLEARA